MTRRTIHGAAAFVLAFSLAAAALAFDAEPVKRDYSTVRIKEFPVAVQCWTFHKFTFYETLDKVRDLGIRHLQPYRGQKLGPGSGDEVFGPDLTDERIEEVKGKLREYGITLVSYGVVNFGNNENEMRKVFDFAKKMGIRTIVTEPQYDDYTLIEEMVREYNINIAIHNHPTPSKYARPETVIRNVTGFDPRIGACADTGHWMRSGVNPVDALVALDNRITDVHLKDLNEFGVREAHDVPFGSGVANVHDILAELTIQDYQGYISIEHENPDELDNPSPSIRKGLDYIRSITYYAGYEQILKPVNGRYTKHGWNHYGPGHFDLDPQTGVLTGQGGMGLFWYGVETYGDFVLELDYMCASDITNSGVFIRVPDVPVSNAYISRSFEIQIGNSGEGIHGTGAVYDAEAPSSKPWNPPGEWNHFTISFVGDTITVLLNDVEVVNWRARPRGKIREFSPEGYIGLQNHDSNALIHFRNIHVKKL